MKIHLLGPSCSGQSTLGKLISQKYQIPYFDTDDIVWIETDPPFSVQRKNIEKMELLERIFENNNSLILGGAAIWSGNFIKNFLDLVIYKYVEQEIRIKRLLERYKKYGNRILPGNDMYENFNKLLEYMKGYETGGMEMRSKKQQLSWLEDINCKIIKLEGEKTLEEELKIVTEEIDELIKNGKTSSNKR